MLLLICILLFAILLVMGVPIIVSLGAPSALWTIMSDRIPLMMFGVQRGPHPLNNKFLKGTRVINLNDEFECAQLSLASSFVVFDAIANLEADDKIVCFS